MYSWPDGVLPRLIIISFNGMTIRNPLVVCNGDGLSSVCLLNASKLPGQDLSGPVCIVNFMPYHVFTSFCSFHLSAAFNGEDWSICVLTLLRAAGNLGVLNFCRYIGKRYRVRTFRNIWCRCFCERVVCSRDYISSRRDASSSDRRIILYRSAFGYSISMPDISQSNSLQVRFLTSDLSRGHR